MRTVMQTRGKAKSPVSVTTKPTRKPKPKPAFAEEFAPQTFEEAMPAEEFVDRRGEMILAAGQVDDDLLLAAEPDADWTKFRTCAEFASDITARYARIRDEFVTIGRMLNHARESLPHGEFLPLLRGALPFAEDTAEKLMAIARSVDANRIAASNLPAAYSTAYELVSMTNEELSLAETAGIVRQDVQRKEVIAFKRSLREPAQPLDRRVVITAEISRLEARIVRLRRELDGLED